MDSKTMLALAIIELILKYGPEVAIKLIQGFGVEMPTADQIRALKVKDPESYFGG